MLKYYIGIVVALFMAACSTLEVRTDYDDSYAFSKIKTYAVLHHQKEGENTLLNDRITDAINTVMQTKGYKKQSPHNPDVLVVYHYNAKDKVDIQTDYQMVGIRRYGFGGTMIATTSAYEYTEGMIIIDILDTQTDKIVFRSIGTLEVEHKKTPQERKAYVQKIITKVMESFPSHK